MLVRIRVGSLLTGTTLLRDSIIVELEHLTDQSLVQ